MNTTAGDNPPPRLLWDKPGVRVDERVMRYLAGRDVILDRELLVHDLDATSAHVRGLGQIGLLSGAEVQTLTRELDALKASWLDGQFVLDERHEDGHSAIEAHLVERLGELGKRVHLGRSRNDQVLVATRLYTRDVLTRARAGALEAGRAALTLARAHEKTLMPGYTHLQRAVPSSVGLWMASFAEAFADDAELLAMTLRWTDACPLGTAAGYGVNLPLPRQRVSDELGFSRVQINPMYAQASRGKFEVQIVCALWQVMQTVRRLAWDLSLFSSTEFGFVTLAPGMTTGSSIMPNKRNPDLAELLRASAGVVAGAMGELQNVLSLPSGYHRDVQLTKEPLLRACGVTLASLELIPALLSGLTLHTQRMSDAVDGPMLATDRAVDLAAGGVPFRDAYVQAARELASLEAAGAAQSLERRTSPGACADLMLDELQARLSPGR